MAYIRVKSQFGIFIRRSSRALEAHEFLMPSNIVVPIETRRELAAKVAKTVPPQKKLFSKRKEKTKRIGSKHIFDQFYLFISGNLGHYYPNSIGWSQGTAKETGLKWPSFSLKSLLMLIIKI